MPGGGQIIHHHLEALHVEQQQIEVHVQTIVLGVEVTNEQLEQRPLISAQNAVA